MTPEEALKLVEDDKKAREAKFTEALKGLMTEHRCLIKMAMIFEDGKQNQIMTVVAQ